MNWSVEHINYKDSRIQSCVLTRTQDGAAQRFDVSYDADTNKYVASLITEGPPNTSDDLQFVSQSTADNMPFKNFFSTFTERTDVTEDVIDNDPPHGYGGPRTY